MHATIDLPREQRSVADARDFVLRTLADCDAEVDVETVGLLTGELVSGAVASGNGTWVTLHVTCTGTQVRVEVEDRVPLIPVQRTTEALSDYGRGLALVAARSADWGAHIVHTSDALTKVVWFAVPTARPEAHPAR